MWMSRSEYQKLQNDLEEAQEGKRKAVSDLEASQMCKAIDEGIRANTVKFYSHLAHDLQEQLEEMKSKYADELQKRLDLTVRVRELEDESKTNQFDPETVKTLDGILCDINPAEIAAQIQSDNLGHWCKIIREEIIKKVSEKYGK